MEVGLDFKNIASYTENMAKGLADKMFFLNKLNISPKRSYLFVDFGCADDILISSLYEILNSKGINAYYIGYDISETMIDLAKTKFNYNTDKVMFTSDWEEVISKMNEYPGKSKTLILSSVIHEVYSYAESDDDIDIFWHRILDSDFDYICIRDMMVSKDINISAFKTNAYKKVDYKIPAINKYRIQFEDIYGKIYNWKNLIHFLLKYRWTINWDREVHENYFPIYIEDFLKKFEKKYNLNYFERFRVPFLDKCWLDDFSITDTEIFYNTHIKTIFERKKK